MAVPRSQWLVMLLLGSLLAGCLTNRPNGATERPLDVAKGTEVSRSGMRIEVRPAEVSTTVGKQLLLVATVYDENNKPHDHRRVEWKLEGPGILLAVDETGFPFYRGRKEDSKSAFSYTNTFEHEVPPNVENLLGRAILPGQTWCVISSAVEGQTFVTAFVPDIPDHNVNRAVVKTNWVDARWQFPQSGAARPGTEHFLATRISKSSERGPASSYRVRYFLLDEGSQASLHLTSALKSGSPREVVVQADAEGLARASIVQLKPEIGSNRIGIEILRPDYSQTGGFAVVARGETKVEWMAPQVKIAIEAPRTAALNQAFPITYSISSTGGVETQPMVMKAIVPPGLELISANPKATADGSELLWSLGALPANQQHTVQVVYRPTRTGDAIASANVRTSDNLRGETTATIQVTEARLQVQLTGPQAALVGENLPYRIIVKNPGNGPATNIRVKAQIDAALDVVGKPGPFETVIDKLDSGQEQAIPLPLSPRQAGKSSVKVTALADGNLFAETPAVGIDVRKPDLKVEVHGPARAYLNQELTWTLRVFNPSDVPLSNVIVRAKLPADVSFRSATNDGRHLNGTVEWNLGTAVGKQWADVQFTAMATRLGQSAVSATVSASPLSKRGEEFQPVSMVKQFTSDKAEAAFEVLGIPSLQLEVFDSADPVAIGQKITYTIRVKNAGTLPATQVNIVADLPPQMKPLSAFGITNGRIDGQRITFPPVDSIRPGLVSVFTIEAQAISDGDGRFRAEVKSLSQGSPITSEEPTRILPRR